MAKKVSKEKKRKANWMWIEQFFFKLDSLEKRVSDISVKVAYDIAELRKRIEVLEEFLGGQDSIKKVLENAKNGRPEH
jgi:hypothetical protein